jgi:hypothetical protein
MVKSAFIVGATYGYTPELCALLNSLDYVGSQADVHLIALELPDELLSQLDKLNYKVIVHNITEPEWEQDRGRSEVVCRKRYWYAGEWGKEYDAICVLDADLVFVRNPWQYFEIASKTGFILGPCKEQNKIYDDPHHYVEGKWMWNFPIGFYNDKDLCNCPVFLDAKVWETALKLSWNIFIKGDYKAPDMDAMNMCFLQLGGYDKIIKFAGNQWLGTNEQHLKPYIRVIDNRGLLQTESGIELFSYHGQYYHKNWRQQQLANRHQCAGGYLKANESDKVQEHMDDQARGTMNTMYEHFKRMLDYKIVIPRLNYRHPDMPYEE